MRIVRALAALCLFVPLTLFQAATAHAPGGGGLTEGCSQRSWGYRCFYGSYTATHDHDEGQGYGLVPTPPAAGYITSAYATLVDENGDRVSRHAAHLHHVVFANLNKDNMMCPGFPDMFFASGKERTKMVMPEGYGYYWDNEGLWGIVYHLMTMHSGHEEEVYVRLDLGFEEVPEGSMIDIKPVWLDVMGCSQDPVWDVLKGSGKNGVNKRSNTMTIPEAGQFVSLGGHLHDGGLKLRLDDTTSGEKLWVARPEYGPLNGGWDLRKMSSFSGVPGPQVAAGDELTLTASYDSTHRWNDVMGIMIGALAPGVLDGPYRLP